MKKALFLGFFLTFGLFAVSAQSMPSITIVNNTGYTIYYIYVSPSDSDEWGDDFLEDKVLNDGESFVCRLSKPLSSVSVYDILLEDEDEDAYIKWETEITNNARIVFTFDDID